ncbi:MAG: class I adenylate-forming enzyme family protein [Acidimicrobiales bacterium]
MTEASARTLFEWLEAHERDRPEAPAIISSGRMISFRELAESTRRLAAGLASIGVGPRDVVAAQLPNCPEFFTLLLATAARGATLQTMHMPYRRAELSNLLGHGEAKVAVAVSATKERQPAAEIVALLPDLPRLETVVSLGISVEGATDFDDLAAAKPTADTISTPDVDLPYVLLYTSGTTAGPKGVPHTARRFLANASSASSELHLTPSDRITSLAPFSHLYGLFTLQIGLAAGACAAMIPAFDPTSLLEDLAELAPTALFTAPAHLAPFVANDLLQPEHLAKTRLVCMSGSTVPTPLATAVDALLNDGSVIGLWGMTELQVGTFGRTGDPFESRVSTAGRAAVGMDLRVVDSAGDALPAGSEGELQARGSSIFEGYLRSPEETEAAFTDDGWFKTGDLASMDRDGFLRLTGRTKEIINRGGIKYNPTEIEALVLAHPLVSSCALLPVADEILGERGCICVEAREPSITLTELCALLDEHGVAKYKWPERIEFFDEFPMTPTRKVRRGVLAALLAERTS